jgi:hypothetical protein
MKELKLSLIDKISILPFPNINYESGPFKMFGNYLCHNLIDSIKISELKNIILVDYNFLNRVSFIIKRNRVSFIIKRNI